MNQFEILACYYAAFALITESMVSLGNGVWELMCWCAYVGSYAEVNDSLAGRVAFRNSFHAAFTGDACVY